ncbi:MAG TPA: lipopolysaccharide assembly protein LapB [Gammaproteobacteria bacterium]|nr:lipopolysaccharide assembly protein LapB [Gammaproteobacteria bacterium]
MAIDGTILLFLLLPVAAASGWGLARRHYRGHRGGSTGLNVDYLKGMNYLINEEPDKAVEVFMRLAEIDNETVDTHLALGSLFRRRGEVDRAIRIHQNLIARPTLGREPKNRALFELGQDYMKAGVLDRAESLFSELRDAGAYVPDALRFLLQIYEQEKDWHRAISVARQLEYASGSSMRVTIAHYYCELAETAEAQGNTRLFRDRLRAAMSVDRNCVRASILQGRLHFSEGDYRDALKAYRRILDQDPRFIGQVMGEVRQCFGRLGDFRGERQFLRDVALKVRLGSPGSLDKLRLMGLRDTGALVGELERYVADKPDVDGLYEFLNLLMEKDEDAARRVLPLVRDALGKVLARADHYRCNNCGFAGKSLHWQCPSCKSWNTILPTTELVGHDSPLRGSEISGT